MLEDFAAALVCVSLVCACANSGPEGREDHPAAPTGAAEEGAASTSHFIALGTSELLSPDVPYRVRGTDLVVISHGAGMRTIAVDGDPNKEDHLFFIALEVAADGQTARLEATDRTPATWGGYRFVADPDGYTWGAAAGAIVVERARR